MHLARAKKKERMISPKSRNLRRNRISHVLLIERASRKEEKKVESAKFQRTLFPRHFLLLEVFLTIFLPHAQMADTSIALGVHSSLPVVSLGGQSEIDSREECVRTGHSPAFNKPVMEKVSRNHRKQKTKSI